MTPEQKARAWDNLEKAIDEKRLAVVPCEGGVITEDSKDPAFAIWNTVWGVNAEQARAAYKAAISAVDQQKILKELKDDVY